MELRHRERPHIFPSRLYVNLWLDWLPTTFTHHSAYYLLIQSNFGLLVLASGLIADYQHQLDNYLMALQAIGIVATLPSTRFNGIYSISIAIATS